MRVQRARFMLPRPFDTSSSAFLSRLSKYARAVAAPRLRGPVRVSRHLQDLSAPRTSPQWLSSRRVPRRAIRSDSISERPCCSRLNRRPSKHLLSSYIGASTPCSILQIISVLQPTELVQAAAMMPESHARPTPSRPHQPALCLALSMAADCALVAPLSPPMPGSTVCFGLCRRSRTRSCSCCSSAMVRTLSL